MQIRSNQLSKLRQELKELAEAGFKDIRTFLSGRPMIKGTVYKLKRKCSKPSCHCTRGWLHESTVLTASISGKTRLWTVPQERIKELQDATKIYRQFRDARARFLRTCLQRQKSMIRIIDYIEKIRLREP